MASGDAAAISVVEVERLQQLSLDTTRELHAVWDEMGLSGEERARQLSALAETVEQVFLHKVADEVALRDEYVSAAEALEGEIDGVSRELGLKRSYFSGAASGEALGRPSSSSGGAGLMARLTWLRGHLEQFQQVRAERSARLAALQGELREVAAELGCAAPAEAGGSAGESAGEGDSAGAAGAASRLLTEEGLREVESALSGLRGQRTRRVAALQQTVRECVALFDDLELEPSSELDMAIAAGGEALGLDGAAVAVLSERAQELASEKHARTERLKELGASIQPLWERLEVGQDERQAFFMNNRGLGLAVIRQCEAELQRLLELKGARMGDLIARAQERLTALWDEMQFSDEQREAFTAQHLVGRVCDETLTAHEEEIQVLEAQAELYRPLLKLIEKYAVLCDERAEYEDKIKDSSRLLSRRGGSALRDEEQQRLRVTKGIPKTILQIKEAVGEYEQQHGPFLLRGRRFIETMDSNEAMHEAQLEEEKQQTRRNKSTNKEDNNPAQDATAAKGATLKKGQLPQQAAKPRAPLAPKND